MAGYAKKNTGAKNDICVYSVADVARVLKIGRNMAYELCHSGVFPIIRIGTTIRIPVESFNKWMKAPKK